MTREPPSEPAPETGAGFAPVSGAGSGDVVTEPEPPEDVVEETEVEEPEPPEDVVEETEVEEAAEPEAKVEAPEPEPEHDPEPKPGELPQIGPLVSAFSAAAASALSEDPREPQKEPEKPVSGEFDLSEFGQFVASFDLDKSPDDDGKGQP